MRPSVNGGVRDTFSISRTDRFEGVRVFVNRTERALDLVSMKLRIPLAAVFLAGSCVLSSAALCARSHAFHPAEATGLISDLREWMPPGSITTAALNSIWMSEDKSEGWAVGHGGIVLQYGDSGWRIAGDASSLTNKNLFSVWLNRTGSSGWAVGQGGVILRFTEGKWSITASPGRVTSNDLMSIWSNERENAGLIVGRRGTILELNEEGWVSKTGEEEVSDRWIVSGAMTQDANGGWAVGEDGIILGFSDGAWRVEEPLGGSSRRWLLSVWINERDGKAWAVGQNGIILACDNTGWKVEVEPDSITSLSLTSPHLNRQGTEGWAVGQSGVILHYVESEWHIAIPADSLTTSDLTCLWMDEDATSGWAVGDHGILLRFERGKWSVAVPSRQTSGAELLSLSMNPEHTAGWAVGDSGAIIRYEDGRWLSAVRPGEVTVHRLRSVWVGEGGTLGWAVGDSSTLLLYAAGEWQVLPSPDPVARKILNAVQMNRSGTSGWVVGEHGTIWRFNRRMWYSPAEANMITSKTLYSICLSDDGLEAWAVGEDGVILHCQDSVWEYAALPGAVTDRNLLAVWCRDDGAKCWAIGRDGVIVHCDNGEWEVSVPPGRITSNDLNYMWIAKSGITALIVGENGTLLRYMDNAWSRVFGPGDLAEIDLVSVRLNEEGTAGWILGSYGAATAAHGAIFQYRLLSDAAPILNVVDEIDFKGLWTITLGPEAEHLQLEIVDRERGVRLDRGLYDLYPASDDSLTWNVVFNNVPSRLEDDLRGKSWYSILTVDYAVHPPIRRTYVSDEFEVVPSPKWHTRLYWAILAVVVLNGLLMMAAIRFSWARRLVLHPLGSKLLGLMIGRYVFVNFLIRFVRPVRLALFREYRRGLRKAPELQKWLRQVYIPPKLVFSSSGRLVSERWIAEYTGFFRELLKQPHRRIYWIKGASGLGKTALTEKWLGLSLDMKQTPFLIHLGDGNRPEETASSLMEQYGDICVTADEAADMLASGGFVVLIDGFNETQSYEGIWEFIRQVSRRNLVVVNGQVRGHQSFLGIDDIELHPFGEEQLKQLIKGYWANLLLKTKHLADLVQLPYTAKLIASYVTKYDRLPSLRLDVYRDLVASLDGDYLMNLEKEAWRLFKKNQRVLEASGSVPVEFCDASVRSGVLTKSGKNYLFRHDKTHRFFVARYLDRQERQTLEYWNRQVDEGLGKRYWIDVLELWGELFAERARAGKGACDRYHGFQRDVANFDISVFASRLYPQIQRLYNAGLLQKNLEFIEWAANRLTGLAEE